MSYTPNSGAQVQGAGTDYTLTNAIARIDFGTTDPEIVLPTAGTYRIQANILLVSDAISASDIHVFQFRNSTDSVFVGPTAQITLGALFQATLSLSQMVSITSAKTIQLWGYNFTVARGSVISASTNIRYIRLY